MNRNEINKVTMSKKRALESDQDAVKKKTDWQVCQNNNKIYMYMYNNVDW